MAKHAHSAAALAETANVDDTSIPLAVEMGEADEQIGESRVGTVENKSWGFQKVVWIGGAVFVGTVIAALVFKWSSATKSPDPHSVTQLMQTGDIIDGGHIFLKSKLTENYYLHVSSGNMNDGDPVIYTDSTTPGSEWEVEYVGGSDTKIMLKNLRSGLYLHVKDEEKTSGDPVYQKDSVTDGSKWQVEYVARSGGVGSMIRLKSVRSGFYLQATPRSKKTCCDPVFQTDSVTDGSTWNIEASSTASEPDIDANVQYKIIVWLVWETAPNADLLKERSKSRQFLTLAEARNEVTLKCSPDEVYELLSKHGLVESRLLEGHWMIWTGTADQLNSLSSVPQNMKDCYRYSQVEEGTIVDPSPSPPGYPETCTQSHWPGYDSLASGDPYLPEGPYLAVGPNPYPLNTETMEPWTTWKSLEKLYNMDADAPSPKKPVIGLIELGGAAFSMDDYTCLCRATGAKTTHIETFPPGDRTVSRHNAQNTEAQLDVQVAATVNQNADIYFVGASNYINLIEYFHEVHTGMKPLPTVLSTSYSGFEGGGDQDFAIAFCNEAYILATAGVTSFAATGDTGASGSGQVDPTSEATNSYHVQWAAACPFVTAVGGSAPTSPGCTDCETSAMDQNFNAGFLLAGCFPPIGCITSSGGFSTVYTKENGYDLSFQAAALRNYAENHGKSLEEYGRGFPDISFNSQNWLTFQGGRFLANAGTSAAAPALAAVVSQAYDGTPFGWINPLLYEKYQEGGYFWDITEGNNYWGWNGLVSEAGYQCEVGWDPVTGVGSFGNSSALGAQRFLDALRSR